MSRDTGRHMQTEAASAGQEHPAQLDIGVVGAGRVGTALAVALSRAGHRVTGASAVSAASRRRVDRYLPGTPVMEPAEVIGAADLVLLTVPDDALGGLVSGLAATGAPLAGRLLAHASGRHGLAVLEPAARLGALPLALHPVMTFTGRPDDVDRIAGISFGVTAPAQLRPAAEVLVLEMGGEPVFIAEEDRGLYHAALAGAANHLVTLVVQAADLLTQAGVAQPARMLGPLLSAALDNALRLDDAALTGPVARGDAETVASHLDALRAAAPEALGAYLAMARLTATRALAAGTLDRSRCAATARRARRGTAMTAAGQPVPGQSGSTPPMPMLARTRKGVATARATLSGPVVLVPTMGALHDGHRSPLRLARELAGPGGSVIVSIFVNPLQFGPSEDFDRYPRSLDQDLAHLRRGGRESGLRSGQAARCTRNRRWSPSIRGRLAGCSRAASRPGFFDGVLTVVLKLFQLTAPDAAVFGQKDAQQLALIRQMVADLDLGVQVAGCAAAP